MSITKEFDTITAISTPLGEGAIGIVRLSGTDALAIAQSVFKGKNLEQVASHTINYTISLILRQELLSMKLWCQSC